MRIAPLSLFAFAACLVVGCGIEQLTQGSGSSSSSASTAGDGGADGGGDSGVVGAGCGVETGSSTQLCVATSLCPKVVVDTTAMPHCGFRIKGASSELVCGCGDSLCSMGAFTTCAQAAALLTSQTEQAVCTQLAEGRCSAGVPTPSTTSSSSSSSGGSACDKTCMSECGGGAACASICGC
jgi:hypothetical protein